MENSRRVDDKGDHAAGFTLVEILAVIMIMAVLMAVVTGGLRQARLSAWRVKARDSARQLVAGWNLHLTDRRCFPPRGDFSSAAHGGFAATPANLALLNKDGIVYLELSEVERDEHNQWSQRSGLRDRWNHHIHFNLNFEFDKKMPNPAPYSRYIRRDGSTSAKDPIDFIQANAIAWSLGSIAEKDSDDWKRGWIVQW